jgi:hypothetical protein
LRLGKGFKLLKKEEVHPSAMRVTVADVLWPECAYALFLTITRNVGSMSASVHSYVRVCIRVRIDINAAHSARVISSVSERAAFGCANLQLAAFADQLSL